MPAPAAPLEAGPTPAILPERLPERLRESVLQFAWAHRHYTAQPLHTRSGAEVVVVHPGRHNTDQGPDFSGATLRIDGVVLHGAVEMHVNGADWFAHGHHTDPAYNGVILHVVAEPSPPGRMPLRADGTEVPELVLGHRLSPGLTQQVAQWAASTHLLPCAGRLRSVPPLVARQWVQRQGVARMADKAEALRQRATAGQANPSQPNASPVSWPIDWPQLLLIELCGAFGGPQNAEAFRMIGAALPLRILQRHAGDLSHTEALLFGLAGLLEAVPVDGYQAQMQATWQYLQQLHAGSTPALERPELPPLHFLRMRPAAFPTLRLAQLAAVLHGHASAGSGAHGLNLVTLIDSSAARLAHWLDVEPTAYWATHYRFGVSSARRRKAPGAQLRQHIVINALVPFAYLYHQARGDGAAAERAVDWLTAQPAEHNAAVDAFARAGLPPLTALDSQGLLHLHRHYCTPRRCLSCAIGHQLLKPTPQA